MTIINSQYIIKIINIYASFYNVHKNFSAYKINYVSETLYFSIKFSYLLNTKYFHIKRIVYQEKNKENIKKKYYKKYFN